MWSGGKLGVSYYTVDTAHLFLMHDTAETNDFELLKRSRRFIPRVPACVHVYPRVPTWLFASFPSLQFYWRSSQAQY